MVFCEGATCRPVQPVAEGRSHCSSARNRTATALRVTHAPGDRLNHPRNAPAARLAPLTLTALRADEHTPEQLGDFAGLAGIEPARTRLTVERSAAELQANVEWLHLFDQGSAASGHSVGSRGPRVVQDSNLPPPVLETGALPDELTPHARDAGPAKCSQPFAPHAADETRRPHDCARTVVWAIQLCIQLCR